jgi:hypothetical protein
MRYVGSNPTLAINRFDRKSPEDLAIFGAFSYVNPIILPSYTSRWMSFEESTAVVVGGGGKLSFVRARAAR